MRTGRAGYISAAVADGPGSAARRRKSPHIVVRCMRRPIRYDMGASIPDFAFRGLASLAALPIRQQVTEITEKILCMLCFLLLKSPTR
jgi:hypothetical protein